MTDKNKAGQRVVWKYKLPFIDRLTDTAEIGMPLNGTILCLQMQRGHPHLWVDCFVQSPQVARRFRCFGTGQELDVESGKSLIYVGTFQTVDGLYIFHVYEEVMNFGRQRGN